MILKLTEEQSRAIHDLQGSPVFLDDPEHQTQYVLLSAEVYQRMCARMGPEQLDVRDTYPALDRMLNAAGWDDPAMDAYNDYDAHRPQR
jgi:hypothetical protein